MSEHFISIPLFIAPNGDFIHLDKSNEDRWSIQWALLKQSSLAFWQNEENEEVNIEYKIFTRQTLKFPCSIEMARQKTRTGPCGAWNKFLRHVIKVLEAKGDAPWTAGLAADD